MPRRKTTKEFIIDAINIHGDRYDYSKVDYINKKKRVEIICLIHGSFWQAPMNHLYLKQGCNKCGREVTSKKLKKTLIQFIEEANKIHDNKYDYSKVDYINNKTKIEIICLIHGSFLQRPDDHLNKNGCNKCRITYKLTNNTFIEKANKVHNNKYDYSKVNYINSQTKIEIICPIHSSFFQAPFSHLLNHGCPICNSSKGELQIKSYLDGNNINYVRQKTFNKCKHKRPLPFDFYLSEYNTVIEYDGRQHFKAIDFFGGEKEFEIRKKRDNIKTNYCLNNNINLIRVPYWNSNEDIKQAIICLTKKE